MGIQARIRWSAAAVACMLLVLLPGGALMAQDSSVLLLVPVGARASALGGATTADGGPDAVFSNPAGLAGVDGSSFTVHHSELNVSGQQMTAFSLLLTPLDVSLSLSYQLFDIAETTLTDPNQQVTGELILRNHLVMASAGTALPADLAAGLSYRLFQQRVDCNGRCESAESVVTTHAFDAGMTYSPRWHEPLQLGAAVVNVAPGQEADDAGSLPSRLHVGAAYEILRRRAPTDALALRASVDYREPLRDVGSRTVAVGMELDVQRAVFLRAGYAPGEGLGTGAAVGLELRYDRVGIAVSRSFVNSQADTEPFQVSFGLVF